MNEVLLKAEGIYKSFGATKAVVDFHIEVCRGTIHGLIGENGSGKSTFSSIVAGIQQRDSGRLLRRMILVLCLYVSWDRRQKLHLLT